MIEILIIGLLALACISVICLIVRVAWWILKVIIMAIILGALLMAFANQAKAIDLNTDIYLNATQIQKKYSKDKEYTFKHHLKDPKYKLKKPTISGMDYVDTKEAWIYNFRYDKDGKLRIIMVSKFIIISGLQGYDAVYYRTLPDDPHQTLYKRRFFRALLIDADDALPVMQKMSSEWEMITEDKVNVSTDIGTITLKRCAYKSGRIQVQTGVECFDIRVF